MGDVKRCPGDMIYIPAGKFKMGSTKGDEDETPVREIELSGYCIDKREVTNESYSQYKPSESPEEFDGPGQPVVNVSWHEADAYCKSLGKRLPTEAEWERAAKGPKGYEYGTRSGKLEYERNYRYDYHYDAHWGVRSTAKVGTYRALRWGRGRGLYDMAGNVAEWVADWYRGDAYESMEPKDPKGPAEGESKVFRGGSWRDCSICETSLRTATRDARSPEEGRNDIGFRCASDAFNPLAKEGPHSIRKASGVKRKGRERARLTYIKKFCDVNLELEVTGYRYKTVRRTLRFKGGVKIPIKLRYRVRETPTPDTYVMEYMIYKGRGWDIIGSWDVVVFDVVDGGARMGFEVRLRVPGDFGSLEWIRVIER